MRASKFLSFAGFLYLIGLGLVAFAAYQSNYEGVRTLMSGLEPDDGWNFWGPVLLMAVVLLFLAIPGLLLIFLDELLEELALLRLLNKSQDEQISTMVQRLGYLDNLLHQINDHAKDIRDVANQYRQTPPK